MTELEIQKIEDYLNDKFQTSEFKTKERKSIEDSCEVYFGDEFIGLIYLENDEGEVSYQFHMSILKEDLYMN